MGATCGCNDKDDTAQEVRVDPVSDLWFIQKQKKLGGDSRYDDYRSDKIAAGQNLNAQPTKVHATPNVSHFAGSESLAELERQAHKEGLTFIEELVFENGAVYRGYLKDGTRHGPGT